MKFIISRPFRGHYYGFVQSPGQIALERLGAEKKDDFVSRITVVFVSPFHGNTPYMIIGWYRNATVYRSLQAPARESGRVFRGHQIEFNLKTGQKDGFLVLPMDERVLAVPRGKGGIGQARIWYADDPGQQAFVRRVRSYVETRKPEAFAIKKGRRGGGWQPDVERRQLIEWAAIRAVWDHFKKLGYTLESVERLNCGWDLEANGRRECAKRTSTNVSIVSEVESDDHAKAVRIRVEQGFDRLMLVIQDDGQGFDVRQTKGWAYSAYKSVWRAWEACPAFTPNREPVPSCRSSCR